MQPQDVVNIQLCQLLGGVDVPDGNKVRALGQAVHSHPYGVVALLSLWQSDDEIHTDLISFPYRDFQGLEQSRRPLVLRLYSPTGVTMSDIQSDVPSHPLPPKSRLEIFVHLGAAWVDRVLGGV